MLSLYQQVDIENDQLRKEIDERDVQIIEIYQLRRENDQVKTENRQKGLENNQLKTEMSSKKLKSTTCI